MKQLLLLSFVLLITLPVSAQKQSKEEKIAIAKAAHETAVKCVENKSFVIIPSSYTDKDGVIETNTENTNFISYETTNLFMQGEIVCDNKYTNIAEVTEYTPAFDKKGNLRLRIVIIGRMVRGTYVISMRTNTNMADVIFTPQSGTIRKFSGPVVSVNTTKYYKRSSPM
ncbi:MAG: hypothetical protein RR555_02880 [Bacteroidales bacterium]